MTVWELRECIESCFIVIWRIVDRCVYFILGIDMQEDGAFEPQWEVFDNGERAREALK